MPVDCHSPIPFSHVLLPVSSLVWFTSFKPEGILFLFCKLIHSDSTYKSFTVYKLGVNNQILSLIIVGGIPLEYLSLGTVSTQLYVFLFEW